MDTILIGKQNKRKVIVQYSYLVSYLIKFNSYVYCISILGLTIGEVKPEEDAEDYSNIDEAVEVKEEKEVEEIVPKYETKGDSDLMPPPTWRPDKESPSRQPSPDKKPLSDLLPKEYKDVDVRQLFPEFEDGKVLRFTRLFKPQYMPKLYRNPNKEKKTTSEKEEPEDPLFATPWAVDNCVGRLAKPEELAEDEMVNF